MHIFSCFPVLIWLLCHIVFWLCKYEITSEWPIVALPLPCIFVYMTIFLESGFESNLTLKDGF